MAQTGRLPPPELWAAFSTPLHRIGPEVGGRSFSPPEKIFFLLHVFSTSPVRDQAAIDSWIEDRIQEYFNILSGALTVKALGQAINSGLAAPDSSTP